MPEDIFYKKKILFNILIGFSICISLSACASGSVAIINEANIRSIISGKTTKSEIIELFGIPDIIVCDSATTVTPKNSYLSRVKMEIQNQASDPMMNNYLIYLTEYIEKKKNYLLSENQIALIYFDPFFQGIGLHSGSNASYAPLEINVQKNQIAGNELAVFIDKKNDIVSDYAYRKEWDWKEYNLLVRLLVNNKDRSEFFSSSEIENFWAEKYCIIITQ